MDVEPGVCCAVAGGWCIFSSRVRAVLLLLFVGGVVLLSPVASAGPECRERELRLRAEEEAGPGALGSLRPSALSQHHRMHERPPEPPAVVGPSPPRRLAAHSRRLRSLARPRRVLVHSSPVASVCNKQHGLMWRRAWPALHSVGPLRSPPSTAAWRCLRTVRDRDRHTR